MTSNPTTSPSRTFRIAQPGGRHLAVDVIGPDTGPAVLFAHAAPGSRRFDPDPTATAAAGVRIVTVDRPGYGGSSPLPPDTAPTIPGYAEDQLTVCDELGLDDVALVGWSAGGRIAAAFAERHPDRTRSLAVVATPAPDEIVGWIPPEHRAMIDQLRADPVAAVGALTEVFAGASASPDARLGFVTGGAADQAVLDDPERRAALQVMVDEAMAQGAVGLALDLVSYTMMPWGLDLTAITAPTRCVYGGDDEVVGQAHGRWYAEQIPAAELEVVPGRGHLVITDVWADLLRSAG